MPISFIAVQCCDCSTMQVKQQKKSSNKWTCVVCNQKQSVRKVFAQSFMAKEVRKFVQSFNMSRQLTDQKQSLSDDEADVTGSPKIEEPKRKRNDWTEYIDDEQEEHCEKLRRESDCAQGDDAAEPMIVTEMPQAKFTKPKLQNYSSRSHVGAPNKRNGKRHQNAQSIGMPFPESDEDNRSQALKWSRPIAQIHDSCKSPIIRGQQTQVINNGNYSNASQKVSKWSSFLTEDDGDNENRGTVNHGFESGDRIDDHLLEMPMRDEIIEEDIHPDFL